MERRQTKRYFSFSPLQLVYLSVEFSWNQLCIAEERDFLSVVLFNCSATSEVAS